MTKKKVKISDFKPQDNLVLPKGFLQGSTPGDDPAKYGLKFDGGKARWDLMPFRELKQIVDKFNNYDSIALQNFDEHSLYCDAMNEITDYFVSGSIEDLAHAGFIMFVLLRGKSYTIEELDRCDFAERWDLIDINEIQKIADIYAYGAKLYAEENWKTVDPSRYKSALMRHFKTIRSKERYDGESGFLHLHHAIWNVLALMWFENQKASK